jgi:hypothetical protein
MELFKYCQWLSILTSGQEYLASVEFVKSLNNEFFKMTLLMQMAMPI